MTNHSSLVDSRRALSWAMAFLTIFVMAWPVTAAAQAQPSARASTADLDAWSAAKTMGLGVNIGNTLENTATWETGWGNPPVTKEYIRGLAALGFKTVRVPVAW